MTLIVDPNTYHPAVGYLVLGGAVIVTRDGCEVLTKTQRELFSVPGSSGQIMRRGLMERNPQELPLEVLNAGIRPTARPDEKRRP